MTTDTTKAPHCPRCGGEMVREIADSSGNPQFTIECEACGFGGTGSSLKHLSYKRDHSVMVARRLVRAELARQALEMWTSGANDIGYDVAQRYVLTAYNWLGTHPLRLPGEEA